MAKLLSNRTAEQIKALLAKKPVTFSSGDGINVRQLGSHFVITLPPAFEGEGDFNGRPPISSADYGSGPGERLPMPEEEPPP